MQIYGILLNICGILLNIRGKTEKYGEFHGILWIFHGKCVENHSFFIPFLSISFLKLLPVDPFSRSFPVVFGRFFGHFWRKSENFRENQRISWKIIPFLSVFIPFLSVFIPFLSTSLQFHSSFSNQPDFMLYNMFIVDTLSERLNV